MRHFITDISSVILLSAFPADPYALRFRVRVRVWVRDKIRVIYSGRVWVRARVRFRARSRVKIRYSGRVRGLGVRFRG